MELPAATTIQAARYSIDAPSWIEGTQTYAMDAADGTFDSAVEQVTARINISQLDAGRHTIFIESQSADGSYGVPTAVFLDVLAAPEAAEIQKGTGEADTIVGGDDSDAIDGLSGDDNLAGGLGEDLLLGSGGNDLLRGDQNQVGNADAAIGDDDQIYGGAGNDRIGGKGGDDILYGDAGQDTIFGDDGDDLLRGGKGADILTGGKDADTFALAYGEGIDTILDFSIGEDLIGLVGALTFNQISVSQRGANAVIEFGKDILARVNGVNAADLTADTFVNVSATA